MTRVQVDQEGTGEVTASHFDNAVYRLQACHPTLTALFLSEFDQIADPAIGGYLAGVGSARCLCHCRAYCCIGSNALLGQEASSGSFTS